MKKAIVMFAVCAVASAQAQIRITEFASGGSLGEYIEITNMGGTSVDLTGWSFDDSSRIAGAFSISSLGVLASGASAVIAEGDATLFRAGWLMSPGIAIVGGNNQNLSGGGDEMNIYDASSTLVDRLTYTAQSAPTVSNNGPVAQLGLNNYPGWVQSSVGDSYGSYVSSGNDIGNPGMYNAVPEPATLAAVGLGLLAVVRRRRK